MFRDSTSWGSKPFSMDDLIKLSDEVMGNEPPESTKFYMWLSPKEFDYMLENEYMDKVVDGGYELNEKARSEGGIGMVMIPENTLIYRSNPIDRVPQIDFEFVK